MTVKLSEDEGATWPVSRAVEPGISGYSDLAVGPDGAIYLLYERGTASSSHYNPRSLLPGPVRPGVAHKGEERPRVTEP